MRDCVHLRQHELHVATGCWRRHKRPHCDLLAERCRLRAAVALVLLQPLPRCALARAAAVAGHLAAHALQARRLVVAAHCREAHAAHGRHQTSVFFVPTWPSRLLRLRSRHSSAVSSSVWRGPDVCSWRSSRATAAAMLLNSPLRALACATRIDSTITCASLRAANQLRMHLGQPLKRPARQEVHRTCDAPQHEFLHLRHAAKNVCDVA